jgi:class I fructose-bisphosphate aldolase
MNISESVKGILDKYEGECPGVKLNLARLFMHGRLAGTGHVLILAVDQGFEHGPTTFLKNPAGFSPHYHFHFAKKSQLSAYTAPLNWLRAGIDTCLGDVPLILKVNHSNRLNPKSQDPDQAVIASVQDALELGSIGVGFTLYPGSTSYTEQLEELKLLSSQARKAGLFTMVWAYPRGSGIVNTASLYESAEKDNPQLALDVIAYSAHMACLAGAHIVKVNLPQAFIAQKTSVDSYAGVGLEPNNRVKHIVDCCFGGKRAVIFSGGAIKNEEELLQEVTAVRDGGGFGSIIGRNIFQREETEALQVVDKIVGVYTRS